MTNTAISHREQNQLLAAMPFEDWRYIESHLEWVEMPAHSTLCEAGSSLRHVYFPTTAVVSLVSTMLDGATVEVAAVGNEGMVGVDAFMGSSNANNGTTASGTVMAQNTALVSRGGHGYRMSAQSIAHQAKRSEQVMHHLLNYTRTLFLHMSQTSACNRHHSLDQQLARWLLVHLDRQADDELHITQERIASMLGVRREGVTGGALRLQKAGVIRYGRGQMSVIDRAGLEAHSCECHGVIREAYSRLSNDAVLQAKPASHAHPAAPSADATLGRSSVTGWPAVQSTT
ncbi:Crp/Fnr family transcriptional regulator [Hydrogenophaga sp.]|uniref:Crp/Fnr family transcriptional regulator n=1 Tax=Hydrogenophaga sp. TaxID=1904254 RepID=UPI002ABC7108|nr:Crp/Fnr family transcriptional regulator [Hydrogenophaga sp.]MDZ4396636.1 Crp/Fnr family transcriptional regulator [Hydrogenophaga sp.]